MSAPLRTIFLLTCRDAEIDFRRPLADALAARGHEVFYIRIQRRPVITRVGGDGPRTLSMPAFVAWMAFACRKARRPLIFNSTNLVLPRLTTLLKKLGGGVWCFDMHDDLLYDKSGLTLVRAMRAQRRKLRSSDIVVHASPTLSELFPQSRHLGNASDLRPAPRSDFDRSRVLILSSLDQRFDFEFLDEVAGLNPSIAFVIAGQIAQGGEGAERTAARLSRSTNDHCNIVYDGPYEAKDLVRLTGAFSISFAPYRVNSRLTRYIDPLRYYHCLNAGMEVATTDIPQARALADRLHILTAPDQFSQLIAAFASDAQTLRNRDAGNHLVTWRQRAEKLVKIVEEHEAGNQAKPVSA